MRHDPFVGSEAHPVSADIASARYTHNERGLTAGPECGRFDDGATAGEESAV